MEKLDRKILITGGTGFLGSYIIRAMLSAGYTNISISKRKESRLELIQNEIEKIHIFETSINDLLGLEEAIEGMDIVIHAAALVSFVPKDRKELFKTNVDGTENVINLCLAAGTKKIIFISSVAAIGRTIGE